MNKSLSRESNIELLRLVAIFFVILHHLTIKGADTVGYITPYAFEEHDVAGVVINSFCICAVNVFLLITGWFGVKNLYKGVVRLIIDCIVFGSISYVCLCIFFDHGFTAVEWFKSSIFTPNRFVTVYMMLLIVSPLIERALDKVDLMQFKTFIILFTIIEVVFGYVFNYSIAAAFIFLNVVIHKWNDALWFFRYNNPLIIITAGSLFLFFTKLSFSNKVVNMLATGVFGTFILQTTPFLIPVRNEYTHSVFEQYGYVGVFVVCCLLYVVCCMLSVPVSTMTQQATKWICNFFGKRFCKVEIKG